MTAGPQVLWVKVVPTFTILQGQVSKVGWMFREDTYADADQTVRRSCVRLIYSTLGPAPLRERAASKRQLQCESFPLRQTSGNGYDSLGRSTWLVTAAL